MKCMQKKAKELNFAFICQYNHNYVIFSDCDSFVIFICYFIFKSEAIQFIAGRRKNGNVDCRNEKSEKILHAW